MLRLETDNREWMLRSGEAPIIAFRATQQVHEGIYYMYIIFGARIEYNSTARI